MRLNWQSPLSDGGALVTNYRVYRGTVSAGENLLTTLANVKSYTDTAVTIGLTYYYEVSALNAAGLEGFRSDEVHAAPSAAPDTSPPTIVIASPANNTIVSTPAIAVSGTSTDDVGVQKVEVSSDGLTWVKASGTTTWSATVVLQLGLNIIYARATDTSGNTRTVRNTVTEQSSGLSSLAFDPVFMVAIAVVVVGGAAVATLLWRRRKKSEPPRPRV